MNSRNRGWVNRLPEPWRGWVRRPLDAVRQRLNALAYVTRRARPHLLAATARWLAATFAAARRRGRDRRLRVAIDATPLWERPTGVGWYLERLLVHLADDSELSLRLYGPPSFGDPNPAQVVLPAGLAIEVVRREVRDDLAIPPDLTRRLLLLLEPWLVRLERNQLVFAPNFVLPPRRFSWAGAPVVTMVHDLAMRKVPDTLRDETRAELASLERFLRRAQAVISPSNTVRQEIVDAGLVANERAFAVHHGPGHLASLRREPSAQEEESGSEAGALPANPFAVHVGTLEPRKNVEELLTAWQSWHQEHERGRRRIPGLLLCGGWGWKSDELRARVAVGIEQGWLRHAGYVSDAFLTKALLNARFLVSASRYEGFGLPLVEAMAAGLPLLVSDIPVHREVARDAALYVSLGEPESWRRQLEIIDQDERVRAGLQARASERAKDFDWRRAAHETAAVWRIAASLGARGKKSANDG